MERSEIWKRNSVLAMNTFGFTVMFAVWVVFAIIGIGHPQGARPRRDRSSPVLVALPILTGSLLRLPIGMATDWIGGRPIFTALLATSAIPLLLLSQATQYWQYLVLRPLHRPLRDHLRPWGNRLHLGLGSPSACRALALGIFGAGNTGASLTKLLAPGLMLVVPAAGMGLVPGGLALAFSFVYAIVGCWSPRPSTGPSPTPTTPTTSGSRSGSCWHRSGTCGSGASALLLPGLRRVRGAVALAAQVLHRTSSACAAPAGRRC